jgi:hypothetical protein
MSARAIRHLQKKTRVFQRRSAPLFRRADGQFQVHDIQGVCLAALHLRSYAKLCSFACPNSEQHVACNYSLRELSPTLSAINIKEI